jgi:DNA modification methylase
VNSLWEIRQGDCLTRLREVPDCSVHQCCTSPPYYSLRDYQIAGQIGLEDTPAAYVARLVEVFREVRRVLRDDGCMFLNLGDSYAGSWGNQGRGPGEGRGTQRPVNGPKFQPNDDRYPSRTNTGKIPEGCRAKPKDLLMIPSTVATALRDDGWYLRSAVPWVKQNCLNGATVIYARTQNGDAPSPLKDLVRLRPSTVKLWNGERWTQVVAWRRNELPESPLEITFRNGQVVKCTSNHKWPSSRGVVEARQLRVGDVVPTCRLPQPDVPASPAMIPDDIGWFVGLYLAEGSMSKDMIHIACHADEAEGWFGKLLAISEKYGGTCRCHVLGENKATIHIYSRLLLAVLKTYLAGRVARDKRLSSACWKRGDEFLRALLEGYLAGDGSYEEKNDRWRLGFCRNDGLESDIRTICARIGASVRIRPTHVEAFGKMHAIYRGSLRMTRPDRSTNGGSFQHAEDGEIVSISPARWAGSFWDVEVADDPHTFALASGIVTHNSMPESVTDRPSNSLEWVFLLAKKPRYFWDAEAVRVEAREYTVSNAVRERNVGGRTDGYTRPIGGVSTPEGGRNRRNGDWWHESMGMVLSGDGELLGFDVNPQPFKGAHFATWPPALVEPMIRAGTSARGVCPACGSPWARVVEKDRKATRPDLTSKYGTPDDDIRGGSETLRKRVIVTSETTGWRQTCDCPPADPVPATVLDPFCGAATTLLVATRLGRRGLGFELNPEYVDLGRRRLVEDAPLYNGAVPDDAAPVQPDLFAEERE